MRVWGCGDVRVWGCMECEGVRVWGYETTVTCHPPLTGLQSVHVGCSWYGLQQVDQRRYLV